ncbi:MAG: OmpW/AlkL family protein [Allosphingosinicella sp.]
MKPSHILLVASAAAFVATPGQAQEAAQPDGYARLGVARVKLADEGEIFINGVQDPQAGYSTPEDWVVSAELGWFVLDQVAVQVSATSPATTSNIPAGSLAGLPSLGDDSFSVFTLTGNFHPLRGGPISPYVGGGLAWHHTWDTDDGLAANLEIGDAVGPVVQAGVEVALGGRFALYFEARQAFYSVEASGDLGPLRVTADPELDPFFVQGGAVIRF